MAADNPLGSGQTNAGALELIDMMETLENSEEFVSVCHIETDAVVADEKDRVIVMQERTELDYGPGTRATKLDSIGEEIGKDLLDEVRIALDGGQRMNPPFDGACSSFGLKRGEECFDNRSERSRPAHQLMPGEPGQFEQIVH